jgi:hypothetical protein
VLTPNKKAALVQAQRTVARVTILIFLFSSTVFTLQAIKYDQQESVKAFTVPRRTITIRPTSTPVILSAHSIATTDERPAVIGPTPTPTPRSSVSSTPSPLPNPTPTPSAPASSAPTPYPTPVYDPVSYLRSEAGRTIHVSLRSSAKQTSLKLAHAQASDLALLVNAADAQLTKEGGGTLSIEGGGSFKNQVTLHHHTVFDGSTYSCDVPKLTEWGVILVADNVTVEGTWRPPTEMFEWLNHPSAAGAAILERMTPQELAGQGTTILAPVVNVQIGVGFPTPGIRVFQALADSISNAKRASNIAIKGVHILDRPTDHDGYDGGVRSTVGGGNCHHCMFQQVFLDNTRSLGLGFGGNTREGQFADDCLITECLFYGLAGANTYDVNGDRIKVIRNVFLHLGHVFKQSNGSIYVSGGVSAFDLEPNNPGDHGLDIHFDNNLVDWTDSFAQGNGVNLQNPHSVRLVGNVTVANNWILGRTIGATDLRGDNRLLSNGLFVTPVFGLTIANNFINNTAQSCMQFNGGSGYKVQDVTCDFTGGGGIPSVMLSDTTQTTFTRLQIVPHPSTPTNPTIWEIGKAQTKNLFEETSGIVCRSITSPPRNEDCQALP